MRRISPSEDGRIESRGAGQSEDLARSHVHDDNRPAGRPARSVLHRGPLEGAIQQLLGRLLQTRVDGKRHVAAGHWLARVRGLLDVAGVIERFDRDAGPAAKLAVTFLLDARNAGHVLILLRGMLVGWDQRACERRPTNLLNRWAGACCANLSHPTAQIP